MQQEGTKKSKLWIWLVVGLALLIAVAGVVLALIFGQGGGEQTTVSSKLYWNVDKVAMTDPESGLSNREVGEDGFYHVRFATGGEQVEYLVADDKRLINALDFMNIMGLEFDKDGVVVAVKNPKDIATEVASEFYVQIVEENSFVINSSLAMNGLQITVNVGEGTGIYDVTPAAEVCGQISKPATMDKVSVYADENGNVTDVFLTEHAEEAELYWRLDQYYNSTTKLTTRVPDENGVYTIPFFRFSDGQVVELKCKDAALVTKIDSFAVNQCDVGLVLDEDGYIIKNINSAVAAKGIMGCYNYSIIGMDGNYIETERFMNGSLVGSTFSATVPEDCVIRMMDSCCGEYIGEQITELQMEDQIIVFNDMKGAPKLILVTRRIVDVPMYYNASRKYNSTECETTRVPDENGYYVYEMAVNGKAVTLRTKDKALATQIDANTWQAMGLEVKGDIIVKYYSPGNVTGWGIVGTKRFVTAYSGYIISLATSTNFTSVNNTVMDENTKIYDVSKNEYGTSFGQETKLRLYDRATVFRNKEGIATHVFITSRYKEGADIYYNLNRGYNATDKVTTKVPDADGYYVYEMACRGKVVTVKTKDKDLATFMDYQFAPVMSLIVNKDGIVKYAGTVNTAMQFSYKGTNLHYVGAINKEDNTLSTYYFSEGVRVDSTTPYKLAENYVVYNGSRVFDNYRGEKTKLKLDDRIQSIRVLPNGEIVEIYIYNRKTDSPLYWKTERLLNADETGTAREPNAEGYYVFDLAVNGEIKQFMTKDKAIADAVEKQSMAFTMKTDGNIILQVYSSTSQRDVSTLPVSSFDVMAIDGDTVTVECTAVNSTRIGEVQKIKLAKNCKIYNVSASTDKFGAEDKLELGDRVGIYCNADGEAVYIYIRNENTHKAGHISYCEHCKKEVFWQPFGNGFYAVPSAHYYLTHDRVNTQESVGATSEAGRARDVVFDLNGYTLTVETRGFVVYGNFSIVDTVGTGKVVSLNTENVYGPVALVNGGTLNVYGGTFTVAEDAPRNTTGGLVYMHTSDSVMNVYGGTFTGGKVGLKPDSAPDTEPRGGNIAVRGTFNMYGGTISGGIAEGGLGGNIAARNSKDKVNIYGGTITGGQAKRGGNIGVVANQAELHVYGGTITEGTASQGGNIFTYASKDKPITLDIAGGKIGGDILVRTGTSVKLSGAPVITKGKNSGLELYETVLMKLGDLTEKASIVVSGKDQISEPCDKAETYKKYFTPAVEGAEIKVVDGALVYSVGDYTTDKTVQEDALAMDFSDPANLPTYCPACGITGISWKPLTVGLGNASGGHYYVADGTIEYTNGSNFANINGVKVCIHLNGQAIKTNGRFILNGVGNAENLVPTVDEAASTQLNIMGAGSIELTADTTHVGLFQLYNASVLNLYGGTFTAPEGKNVVNVRDYSYMTNAAVNLYEGAVLNEPAGANTIELPHANLNVHSATINGKLAVGANAQNVYLEGAPVIGKMILAGGKRITLGELTTGTSVSVSASDGAFTYETENAETYRSYFTPAQEGATITAENGVLIYTGVPYVSDKTVQEEALAMDFSDPANLPDYCPACGITGVEWVALTDRIGAVSTSKHYYLTGDVEYTGTSYFMQNTGAHTVCVHLNGHSITTTSRFNTSSNGTLSFMGNGTVTHTNGTEAQSQALIYIHKTGTVNLYGGTYNSVKGGTKDASPVVLFGKDTTTGALNLYKDAVLNAVDGAHTVDIAPDGSGSMNINYVDGGTINGTLPQPPAPEDPDDEYDPNKTVQENALIMDFSDPADLPNYCPACGTVVTWKALSGASVSGDGHYYLDGAYNYAGSNVVNLNGEKTVCIHLNGQQLSSASRAILQNGAVLNVMGSGSWTHTNTKDETYSTAAFFFYKNATVNLYGGTYSSIKGGDLDATPIFMIRDNAANANARVNLYKDAVLTGTDGVTTVDLPYGSLNFVDGGAVNGTVNVGANAGTVTLAGKAVIDKLVLADGKLITLGALAAESNVTVQASVGAFTTENANASAYETYFHAATNGHTILTDNNKLVYSDGTYVPGQPGGENTNVYDPNKSVQENALAMDFSDEANLPTYCPACGATNVQWVKVEGTSNISRANDSTNHFYLAAGYGYTGSSNLLNIQGGKVCLHLNNVDMTTTGRINVIDNKTVDPVLNIMGAGSMTLNSSHSTYDAVLFNVYSNTQVNLYGGTYGTTSSDETAVPVIIIGDRTASADTNVTIHPGVVLNAPAGEETIRAPRGNLTVNGATVHGIVNVGANAGTVTLAGKTVIGNLILADGKLITLGELVDANINIQASVGAITGENANAADYAEFFHAPDGYTVKAENNTLVYAVDASGEGPGGGGSGNQPENTTNVYDPTKTVQENAANMRFEAGNMPTYCPACGATNVEWVELTDRIGSVSASKHYYLTSAVEYTGTSYFMQNTGTHVVCVHLNGQNITTTARLNTSSSGILNIMGSGNVTHTNGTSAQSNALFYIHKTGTLNLYGGTYSSVQGGTYPVSPVVMFGKDTTTGSANVFTGATLNAVEGANTVDIIAGGTGSINLNVNGGTVNGTVPGSVTQVLALRPTRSASTVRTVNKVKALTV